MLVSAESQVQVIWSKSRAQESSPELVELVWSKGHPRAGISPEKSSIKSRMDVAFALIQVGDLLGAGRGSQEQDRTEARVGWSSGEQDGLWRHGVVQR